VPWHDLNKAHGSFLNNKLIFSRLNWYMYIPRAGFVLAPPHSSEYNQIFVHAVDHWTSGADGKLPPVRRSFCWLMAMLLCPERAIHWGLAQGWRQQRASAGQTWTTSSCCWVIDRYASLITNDLYYCQVPTTLTLLQHVVRIFNPSTFHCIRADKKIIPLFSYAKNQNKLRSIIAFSFILYTYLANKW